MEVFEAIKTRLETKQFDKRHVPAEIKREILESGRLAPSAMNWQHWRFVLMDQSGDLKKLAEISTTGRWIAGADFAIVVLTDPKEPFGKFDAAKASRTCSWSHGRRESARETTPATTSPR
jgi:nitroreductase